MTEEEATAFYERKYHRLYQGGERPDEGDMKLQHGRAEALLAFAGPRLGKVARHLDIGSSAGLLLQRIRDEFGSQPVGIEPGNGYRAYAGRQGLRVYATLDELKAGETEPFDLITMMHVLEHMPDPLAYLRELRESLLAPQGRVLIEVPNLYAHDCFEIGHTVAFSPHTLAQILSQAGYEVLAARQHGMPRSRLVPLYLTVLARPAEGGVQSRPARETGVQMKRRLGILRRRILMRMFPHQAWISPDRMSSP
jgi:SAM-dependent methyltransferase